MAAPRITSPVVGALETIWGGLQRRYPDLPDVAITLGDGTRKGGAVRGHFHASQWEKDGSEVHEVFLAGQRLKDGPEGVLSTLVHEAAHALCHARGIQDTSRQGRYHNAKFRDMAQELGLTVEKDRTIGWSITSLSDEARKTYRADLDRLSKVITAHRRSYGIGTGAAKRKSSNNGVSCSCDCGRKVRMSLSVYEAGPITCGVCKSDFTAAE